MIWEEALQLNIENFNFIYIGMILGSTMALNFIYIFFFSPNLIANVEGLITCSFLGNVFILSYVAGGY